MIEAVRFTNEQLSNYKEKLNNRRSALIEKIASIKSLAFAKEEAETDPLDIASNVEEKNRLLAELSREEILLKRTEFALRNFSGFGSCISCGDDIDPLRLDFDPSIIKCADCQKDAEILSKTLRNR